MNETDVEVPADSMQQTTSEVSQEGTDSNVTTREVVQDKREELTSEALKTRMSQLMDRLETQKREKGIDFCTTLGTGENKCVLLKAPVEEDYSEEDAYAERKGWKHTYVLVTTSGVMGLEFTNITKARSKGGLPKQRVPGIDSSFDEPPAVTSPGEWQDNQHQMQTSRMDNNEVHLLMSLQARENFYNGIGRDPNAGTNESGFMTKGGDKYLVIDSATSGLYRVNLNQEGGSNQLRELADPGMMIKAMEASVEKAKGPKELSISEEQVAKQLEVAKQAEEALNRLFA